MCPLKSGCENVQKQLVELWLEPQPRPPLPQTLVLHLETCADCRNYREGLNTVQLLFPNRDYYSPRLRQRTLAKLRSASEALAFRETLLLVLGSLVSIPLSFFLPMWLLSWLVRSWLDSASLSWGVSFVAMSWFGLAAVLASSVILWKKGYFRFNGKVANS